MDELRNLKALYEDGYMVESEYNRRRVQLINQITGKNYTIEDILKAENKGKQQETPQQQVSQTQPEPQNQQQQVPQSYQRAPMSNLQPPTDNVQSISPHNSFNSPQNSFNSAQNSNSFQSQNHSMSSQQQDIDVFSGKKLTFSFIICQFIDILYIRSACNT